MDTRTNCIQTALSGSKHLEFLLKHNVPKPRPSPTLDALYTAGILYPTRALAAAAPAPTPEECESTARDIAQLATETQDTMLLRRWNGKLIAEKFNLPDMEVEIERAVSQVEDTINGAAKEKKSDEDKVEERAEEEEGMEGVFGTIKEEIMEKAKGKVEAQGRRDR